MSRLNLFIIYSLLCLALPHQARANTNPALFFSDLTSGPATGLGDSLGSGAIVTVWGHDLGSSQGTSTLSICGQAPAHIYYWKNADGQLPGGPADLYTSHKMQEIAFSVPSECSNGATTINVTVEGVTSNTLPFTIRAGRILHVKSTGNDSTGNGSWSSPYLTMQKALEGTITQAGDTVYSHGVGSTTGLKVGYSASVIGTETNPVFYTSYPNTLASFSGGGESTGAVIQSWYPSNRQTNWVHVSKVKVTCYGNGEHTSTGFMMFENGRIIGVEITGPNVYGGYSGAIGGAQMDGGKYLGVYIHDYGYDTGYVYSDNSETWTSPPYNGVAGVDCTNCTSTDRFQHLYYVSCRDDSDVWCKGYEIGWNHLADNPILHGIHIYDMGPSVGWQGELLVHDNVVINQLGGAIDIATTDDNKAVVKVWNNLLINTNGSSFRVLSTGTQPSQFYNNTSYNQSIISIFNSGDEDVRGNIFYDSLGVGFIYSEPPLHSNNLTYSSGGASTPLWLSSEAGHVSGNPQFVNVASGDFGLSSSSPAINAGYNHRLDTSDFSGNQRDAIFDIGAYEWLSTDIPNIKSIKLK